jgi:predicted nucleic acid-binding protein
VPVLRFYEASAVPAREQNRGTLAAPKADAVIAELKALRIAADAESAARVFDDVHRLALDDRLPSCDAAYLKLAVRLGLPLATLDDELIRASKIARSHGALGSMVFPRRKSRNVPYGKSRSPPFYGGGGHISRCWAAVSAVGCGCRCPWSNRATACCRSKSLMNRCCASASGR